MKPKSRTKDATDKSKNGKAKATSKGQPKVIAKAFLKYIEPQFTQDLIAHMHSAKKKALKESE